MLSDRYWTSQILKYCPILNPPNTGEYRQYSITQYQYRSNPSRSFPLVLNSITDLHLYQQKFRMWNFLLLERKFHGTFTPQSEFLSNFHCWSEKDHLKLTACKIGLLKWRFYSPRHTIAEYVMFVQKHVYWAEIKRSFWLSEIVSDMFVKFHDL